MDENAIERYRTDLEIVRQTAEQVIKDLQVFGIEIRFSGNELTAYDELKSQLLPVLKELHKNDMTAFHALLYRIDLPEKEFLQLSKGASFYGQLTDAVLRREFKKVLIRRFFKDKNA
ncbi:MAG: hypothetical protein RL021_1978 [Bacteroidota bacterium]